MPQDSERVLIDTNVLIYATLRDDPRHERSRRQIEAEDSERYVSMQNLGEMYPNLTGPKMQTPDSPGTARAKIASVASLPGIHVLPLTGDVTSMALELCEKHGITRQRYYDAQLVATMLAHGIRTLITENAADFQGFSEIRAVDPFAGAEA